MNNQEIDFTRRIMQSKSTEELIEEYEAFKAAQKTDEFSYILTWLKDEIESRNLPKDTSYSTSTSTSK